MNERIDESEKEVGASKGVEEEAEDTLSDLPSTTTTESGGNLVTTPEPISLIHSQLEDPSSPITSSQPTPTSISTTVSIAVSPPSQSSSTAPINQNCK